MKKMCYLPRWSFIPVFALLLSSCEDHASTDESAEVLPDLETLETRIERLEFQGTNKEVLYYLGLMAPEDRLLVPEIEDTPNAFTAETEKFYNLSEIWDGAELRMYGYFVKQEGAPFSTYICRRILIVKNPNSPEQVAKLLR